MLPLMSNWVLHHHAPACECGFVLVYLALAWLSRHAPGNAVAYAVASALAATLVACEVLAG